MATARSAILLILMTLVMAIAAQSATPGAAGQTIAYETGPCFGTCPVYRVEVASDGSGLFVGTRYTAASEPHAFTVTREQFDAFADRLAPYRPDGERQIVPGSPNCGSAVTDLPTVSVEWTEAGTTDRLVFYYGCQDESVPELSQVLASAPGLLPIGDLIGR